MDSSAREEQVHCLRQARAVGSGVEPAGVQLAAQPGELPLGQLAGGGDGAFAEGRRIALPVQELPRLAVTDGAHGRQVQRRGDRLQAGQGAQPADFVEEALRQLRALPGLQAVAAPLDLPAVRAVGYRQAWEFLDGQGDAAAFRERAIQATRQLAKRQLTWLRGALDARWFDPATDGARLAQALDLFLPRG